MRPLSADILESQGGFTLVELIVVLVCLSLLAAIAIPKYLEVLRYSEIAAEDATIANLQAAVDTQWAEMLMHGEKPQYPKNPFLGLKKLPMYYRLGRDIPNGTKQERDVWIFLEYSPEIVKKLGIEFLESENAPALVKSGKGQYKPESVTKISGLILHHRGKDKVFFWIYDRSRGVISGRFEVPRT